MADPRRGDLWLTTLDATRPVVLLNDAPPAPGAGLAAIQTVAAATPAQRQGFVLLTPEEAAGPPAAAGPAARARGIELALDPVHDWVVRVALPGQNRIFCTWQVTLTPADLTTRAGALPPATLRRLDLALKLAGHR